MRATRSGGSATLGRLKGSVPVFAALGDATRLALIARLCQDGPHSIARLTHGSAMTRQAVTKHLHVLSEAGLVRSTSQGREQIWEFAAGSLDEARAWMEEISRQWDVALGRLKRLVEE